MEIEIALRDIGPIKKGVFTIRFEKPTTKILWENSLYKCVNGGLNESAFRTLLAICIDDMQRNIEYWYFSIHEFYALSGFFYIQLNPDILEQPYSRLDSIFKSHLETDFSPSVNQNLFWSQAVLRLHHAFYSQQLKAAIRDIELFEFSKWKREEWSKERQNWLRKLKRGEWSREQYKNKVKETHAEHKKWQSLRTVESVIEDYRKMGDLLKHETLVFHCEPSITEEILQIDIDVFLKAIEVYNLHNKEPMGPLASFLRDLNITYRRFFRISRKSINKVIDCFVSEADTARIPEDSLIVASCSPLLSVEAPQTLLDILAKFHRETTSEEYRFTKKSSDGKLIYPANGYQHQKLAKILYYAGNAALTLKSFDVAIRHYRDVLAVSYELTTKYQMLDHDSATPNYSPAMIWTWTVLKWITASITKLVLLGEQSKADGLQNWLMETIDKQYRTYIDLIKSSSNRICCVTHPTA